MSDISYLAIVNPSAGGGRCRTSAPAAIDALRDKGLNVEVEYTIGPNHATEITRQHIAKGRQHFIAVGGDGTTFEILNGLFPWQGGDDDRPTLGFLALGTGNSFLQDFSDNGAQHAIRALTNGSCRACDVIELTHDEGVLYYLNLLSLGFVAEVCDLTNRRFKSLGEHGYTLGVLGQLARLKAMPFPLRIDGQREDRQPITLLSFSNSRFTGGKMMMAPNADPTDGKLDVIQVNKMRRLTLLRTFVKIFSGTHVNHPKIDVHQAREIEFNLRHKVPVMVDGEVLHLRPLKLRVLPSALQVKV